MGPSPRAHAVDQNLRIFGLGETHTLQNLCPGTTSDSNHLLSFVTTGKGTYLCPGTMSDSNHLFSVVAPDRSKPRQLCPVSILPTGWGGVPREADPLDFPGTDLHVSAWARSPPANAAVTAPVCTTIYM